MTTFTFVDSFRVIVLDISRSDWPGLAKLIIRGAGECSGS